MSDPMTQSQHLGRCGGAAELPLTGSTWRCEDTISSGAIGWLPGMRWTNPLAVTTAAEIQAQESFWFTCTFPGERIAVLRVYGAQSQEHARTAVHGCWPKCQYTVTDGDESQGHAHPFTLIFNRNEGALHLAPDQGAQDQECGPTGTATPAAPARQNVRPAITVEVSV